MSTTSETESQDLSALTSTFKSLSNDVNSLKTRVITNLESWRNWVIICDTHLLWIQSQSQDISCNIPSVANQAKLESELNNLEKIVEQFESKTTIIEDTLKTSKLSVDQLQNTKIYQTIENGPSLQKDAIALAEKVRNKSTKLSSDWASELARADKVYKTLKSVKTAHADAISSNSIAASKINTLSEQLKNITEYNFSQEETHDLLKELEKQRKSLTDIDASMKTLTQSLHLLEEQNIVLEKLDEELFENTKRLYVHLGQAFSSHERSVAGLKKKYEYNRQDFLDKSLEAYPNWSRHVTPVSHIPYFKNHETKNTTWNHPEYTKMLNTAFTCWSDIRFAAYRAAFVLRHIQKAFGLHKLFFSKLQEILIKNIGTRTELDIDTTLDILEAVYETLDVSQVEVSIDISMNFIFNLFDEDKTGKITALELSTFFILMCAIDGKRPTALDKQKAVFKNCCFLYGSRKDVLTKAQIKKVLVIFLRLTEIIGEGETFGTKRLEVSCEKLANDSITLKSFLSWFGKKPQWFVWLNVYISLEKVDTIDHNMLKLELKTLKGFKLDFILVKVF